MGEVIARPPLPEGPYLVVGLARSGVAAAEALAARGYPVVGTDAKLVGAEVRDALGAAGVVVRDGQEGGDLLRGVATIVKSPGVPREAPVIAAALAAGIRVIGEIELGWRLLEQEFVALTGSNGKTTTVELVGHVYRTAGLPVTVAGNVGTALTSLPGTLEPGATVVCEVSSFQLEDTEAFAPEAAVLLNLAEDHLDRHGTFDHYRAAKLEIFAHQPAGTVAVVPAGLPLADAGGQAALVTFGDGDGPDLAHRGGTLFWRGASLMAAGDLRIRGPHNRANAMAAAAVCLARGVPEAAVVEGLHSFAGVPHRLEEIATVDGVLYVNDSKATNVASAEVAINSFPGGVHLIAGGRGKGSDYTPLAAPVRERCRAVYLIGETAAALHHALVRTDVPITVAGDHERAFAAAHAAAEPGDVDLLSPGGASYDPYRSYEERGNHFRALVAGLG
jgi:UDP-N-acetylmuramoylalanine--D-glutamate ligase